MAPFPGAAFARWPGFRRVRFDLQNDPTPQLVAWLERASDRPALLRVRALGPIADVRRSDGSELDEQESTECAAIVAAHNREPIRRRPPIWR